MQVAGAHYHVVGAAGVGMSAVAELLVALGARVTGSDRFLDHGERIPILDTLDRAGVRWTPQDGSALNPATAGVVVSSAIESDNPDRLRAQTLGCPVLHRAELLARLAAPHRLIAVAGTAGKTTVTGWVGWILEQAGWDPTVVNGGALRDWESSDRVGSVRVGHSDWWVLETDESDRSLLAFSPERALITNISQDHFALEDVEALFRTFAARSQGEVLVGAGCADRMAPIPVRACEGEVVREGAGWFVQYRGWRFCSPLLGRHNAENALAAVNLCDALGAPMNTIEAAVGSFGGIRRRLENVGRAGGITVIDDYAHNPVKIAAAWSAARERGPRVHAVWRPHGFGPLALLYDDLINAVGQVLQAGDRFYLLPVFYAGGTAGGKQDSTQLGDAMRARGWAVTNVANYHSLTATVLANLREGDVVLVMGARDPGLPRFCRALLMDLDAARGNE